MPGRATFGGSAPRLPSRRHRPRGAETPPRAHPSARRPRRSLRRGADPRILGHIPGIVPAQELIAERGDVDEDRGGGDRGGSEEPPRSPDRIGAEEGWRARPRTGLVARAPSVRRGRARPLSLTTHPDATARAGRAAGAPRSRRRSLPQLAPVHFAEVRTGQRVQEDHFARVLVGIEPVAHEGLELLAETVPV